MLKLQCLVASVLIRIRNSKSRQYILLMEKLPAYLTNIRGKRVAVIPRHAGKNHIPPHRINYRANIWAVHALGAKRVISTNSVGSMRGHPVGSFLVLDDFMDFTRNRPSTFYDDRTVHVDVSEPYCPEIRTALRVLWKNRGFPTLKEFMRVLKVRVLRPEQKFA